MDEIIKETQEQPVQETQTVSSVQQELLDAAAQMPQPVKTAEEETAIVADIRFRNSVKTYFFDPNGLQLTAGCHVVMDTARGDEYGIVVNGNHSVPVSELVPPLRKVLRLATAQDDRINEENQAKEKRAFEICQQKIAEHNLEMQLVSAECAFDGSKLLFFFTADGRVDFRELVKDLASSFRTRIELRQIGVRDKAKLVGGLGVCGRPFCCKEFLDDFQPVSIKMAKTQNLSLNPTKISGTCGRLMCCLKYEQEAYEDLIRSAPKSESFVDTPDGRGTVTEVNLLRQSVKVRMEDHPENINCYKNCDICILRSGKAKKNEPPVPKEVAPISSKPRVQSSEVPEESFAQMPDMIFADAVAVSEAYPSAAEEPESAPAEAQKPEESSVHAASQHRRRNRGGRNRTQTEKGAEPEAKAPEQPRPPRSAKPQSQPRPENRPEKQEKAERSEKPNYHRRRHHSRGQGGDKKKNPTAEE